MPSALSPEQQDRVVAALLREYRHLGVNRIDVVRAEVGAGKWDDHPAATRPGRPVKADPRRHRVRVYLTAAEVELLDRLRGDLDRSQYMTLLLRLDARGRGEGE